MTYEIKPNPRGEDTMKLTERQRAFIERTETSLCRVGFVYPEERADVDEMIHAGLLEQLGLGDVRVTEAGLSALQENTNGK